MAHTKEFYQKQYDKYKAEVKDLGGFDAYAGFKKPLESFAAYYDNLANDIRSGELTAKGTIARTMAYTQVYPTTFTTAAAMKKAIKQLTGENLNIRDIQKMTWAETKEKYGTIIKAYYDELRKEGNTSYQARAKISLMFYGSP